MSCHISIDLERAKALKSLYDYCGTNCSQFYSYITTVIKNINSEGELTFTPEFVASWKSKNKLDINETPSNELKDAIIEFFNKKYPTIEQGTRKTKEYNKVDTFGYTSVGAREFGKRLFANKIIQAYWNNESKGLNKKKEDLKKLFVATAIGALSSTLARRLSNITGVNEKEIKSNFTSNGVIYIKNLLKGHEDKVNTQLQNLIALYSEFTTTDLNSILGESTNNTTNPFKEFIDEVMYDSRLISLDFDKKTSLDDVEINKNQEEDTTEDKEGDTDNQTKEAEYDTSIKVLDNKLGTYTSFMTHVSAPIKALLSTLPKMTTSEQSDGKFVTDTDNEFGIADVMDAEACSTILYHFGRYDNPTVMMESIEDISNQLPDYACFKALHERLSSDLNLQIAFYRTFGKTVIGKLETVVENGKSTNRISNRGINRTDTLRFNFINALKGTTLSVVIGTNEKQAALIHASINDYIEIEDDKGVQIRELCDKLAEELKVFYPDINNLAIRNFVLQNKNTSDIVDRRENLYTLHNLLAEAIKGAKDTQDNYKNIESELGNARRKNRKIKNQIKNGIEVTEQLVDVNPLYAKGYLSEKSEAAAISLANLLSDYTIINTPLNSRNVEGNQSSDVINSSMMTNVKDIIENTLNKYKEVLENGVRRKKWDENAPIVRLGEHRFQSKQYDYSTILLEHRDEKGNIINYGLFYEKINDDGTKSYVPTDYATDLIKINLFNGASNLDEGSNALYVNMTQGDYIGTAWRNFFNSTSTSASERVADYFMRIPSDAPKTFTITAPVYSIDKLLSIANKKEINAEISAFINNISARELDNTNGIELSHSPIVVNKNSRVLNTTEFVKHLQAIDGKTTNIKIPINRQNNLRKSEGKVVSIAFRYTQNNNTNNNDNNVNVYIMRGTYEKGTLINAEFVGFKKDTIDQDNVWQEIRSNIEESKNKLSVLEGGYKWDINKNHQIFKQLVNVFRQELTDMATAATVMFETTIDKNTGLRRIKMNSKEEPVLKKNSPIIKSNTDHNGLHPVYHFADKEDYGKGKIFVMENGVPKLTGKVFTSDRFVLYDYFTKDGENPIRNYGQEILDNFALLQQRTTNPNLLLQFDENGNVVLSAEQQSIIEDTLQQFILDYVEHARHRLQDFAGFIENSNKDITTENIAEFILNTHLAYVGFNDLFEGDTKFYKDAQTFLKRAKESQGSGVPYGLVDITKPIQPGHNKIESPLDGITLNLKTKNGTHSYRVNMYDTFSAITVYNTVKTDVPMLENLVSTLTNKDIMGDSVLTEENARTLLYGPIITKDGKPVIKNGQAVRKGGYQETTVNDAQSYITFDEWIRRITARGQLPQYKKLIDRILDETTPLRVDDIKEFVQVQKNFYYDQYYNDNTKIISPRQIKNAEFVLVPRFIRGTELEKVAKLMSKLGVDQLNTAETSKAAQSNRFVIWDKDGHISQDILDDIDNPNAEYKSDIMINGNSAKEYYNYNYLYTQQEVPQHVDSENKAGIQVMKKILDNINDRSPKHLIELKNEFNRLYCENIRNSFVNLAKRFNIELDENGSIVLDESGNIKGLDYNKFYDVLKDELARLGIDSNMADYCTKDPDSADPSKTIMPNYVSLFGNKFENIVQSLFNNAITRQTLPGFHAAQITGIGFRKLSEMVDKSRTSNILQYHPQLYVNKEDANDEITEREYKLLSKEEQKKYKKGRVANYVEIMLPANAFGFDRNSEAANKIRQQALDAGKTLREAEEEVDKMFLTQLKHNKLDEIIGYRIPTEGKQSICCFKVVGFTSDAHGSTIVVPDAWVSQTGSDFDVDSVYGIQYATYINKKGVIKASEYKTDKRELYKDYIFRNLSPEERLNALEEGKLSPETINELREQNKQEKTGTTESFLDAVRNLKSEALFGVLEDIAEEKGLDSFEDFEKRSVEELNTNNARKNRMLDIFKSILADPASFEENLSRSNFDDIIASLNKFIVGNTKLQRIARTPYNILDQAAYQEDAMSGARLKAFSVSRDTFCSICNSVQPELENNAEIRVVYSKDNYNKKELEDRFREENVSRSSTGDFIVVHRTFGWTNDNKNVDGKILTAYSSQTTAHILDAIKSGNVPNVNELTFQVYKTLVDIGSNYDTAISFIMQPGIRRIIDAYNKTNSIYSEERGKNYILNAVRSILDDLNIAYDNSQKLDDLLATVNSIYDISHSDIFGENFEFSVDDAHNANIALNSELQLARLAEQGIFEKSPLKESDDSAIDENTLKLLYDLQTILQYNKIDKLANDIRDAARVLNPDKFGAKQTIFATRQVFDSIIRLVGNTDSEGNSTFRLQKNGTNIVALIYPGVENFNDANEALNGIIENKDFVANSKYPSLAAFLKYATATSIKINKTLFVTQSDEFVNLILDRETGLASVLSAGNYVTEKLAKDFQNYVINYIMLQSEFLQTPLHYNVNGRGFARGFDYIGKSTESYNYKEAARVSGYGKSAAIVSEREVTIPIEVETATGEKEIIEETSIIKEPFTVADVNNPTQEEVDAFNTMSPAQKITWIKRHFRDSGIFKHINVTLYNEYATRRRKAGTQTIAFDENSVNIETALWKFNEAFTNKNPLIACAAADIVKYAFFVEGYRMGAGNVSKIIKNDVLTKGGRIFGTNIINNANDKIENITEFLQSNPGLDLIENFVRSNSNLQGINSHNVVRTRNGFELARRSQNLIQINGNTTERQNLIEKYSIAYKDNNSYVPNTYVRLRFGKDTILYKIKEARYGNLVNYFLIPLNNLDKNEVSYLSANENNNKYPEQHFYEELIDSYISKVAQLTDESTISPAEILTNEIKEYNKIADDYKIATSLNNISDNVMPIKDNPGYHELVKKIKDWYKTSIETGEPRLFVWNNPLGKSITKFGIDNGVVQRIEVDGSYQTFRIYKYNNKRLVRQYTGKNIDKKITPADEINTPVIELMRNIARRNEDNHIDDYYPNIYVIETTDFDVTEDDGLDFSTLLDVAVQSTSSIYRRSSDITDKRATDIGYNWRTLGIKAKASREVNPEEGSVNVHMNDIIISTAKYIKEKTQELENRLKHYIIDPETEQYLAVNDVKCINLIKKDPIKRREYLRTILEPSAIIEDFGLIADLDIESEDANLQKYLTEIKTSVERMKNLSIVANAYEKFAQEYYDKLTDNPNVKNGFTSVLDGFNKTNWFNAMFNDIQETSNPIIQLAMKNFQADLRAKQFQARKVADDFIKHVKEIEAKAKAEGKTFDLNKVIDEYGRFKQKYNQKFIDDRNRLRKEVNAAIQKYGANSIEHIKAKLEYDEWKAKHVEQEVVKEYYEEKNRLVRKMIAPDLSQYTPQELAETGVKGLPEHFAKYEKLRIERGKLLSQYQDNVDNPELDKKLDQINVDIQNLHYDNESDDSRQHYLKSALHDYILKLRALNDKYFKYDPVYNFDVLVEENLRIVRSYEDSGKPVDLYAENPEYVKAKRWLRRNTIIEPVLEGIDQGELEAAYDKLGGWEKNKTTTHSVRRNKRYVNIYGEFDPRLVENEVLAKVKEEQRTAYSANTEASFSDKTLISSSKVDNTVYSREFYNKMSEGRSAKDNKQWQEIVTKINNILGKYYVNDRIAFETIPQTEQGLQDLKELKKLYEALKDLRGDKKSKETKKFIKENVKFDYNTKQYEEDVAWANGLPKGAFRSALMNLIKDLDYDDNIVPNSFIYGFVRPKDSVLEKYTDKEKTKAIETINKYTEKRLSEYYWLARDKARNLSKEEFNTWIEKNHIYNPYTHAYEPLSIWYEYKYKTDKYNYYPTFGQTTKIVRDGYYTHKEAVEFLDQFSEDEFPTVQSLESHYFEEEDHRNKNYKKGLGLAENYIEGSNAEYDNKIDANEYELEAANYIKELLLSLANTQDSRRYIERGKLPARNKERPNDANGWIKEIAKTFGWTDNYVDPNEWYNTVDYSKDRPSPMPMLEQLKAKGYKDIPKYPKRQEGQSDEDYAKEIEMYENKKETIEKDNLEIHKALLDKDWLNVISDFIVRAGTYNAIQDNKYELFYAQQLIKKYGSYLIGYGKNGAQRLVKNNKVSQDSDAEYLKEQDKYLIEQFDNTLRRILYDQFKSPNSPILTKWFNRLQSLTSAQYMMLNYKGGIANVTLGESSIMAENAAEEFLGTKHYVQAKGLYFKSIFDYIIHSKDDKASTVEGAIIKFMDVVDYDEHSGVIRETKDAYEALKRIRDYGYSPQTAGEHEMQNSLMFATMLSHRLFVNPRAGEFNQPKYIYKNFAEYSRDAHEKALMLVLNDEEIETYKKFKQQITNDANEFKEFAWYQKDVTTEFASLNLDRERQKEFVKKRKELTKNLEKEFNDDKKHPTIFSQLDIKDGKMSFAKGSLLDEININKENRDPSDAFSLMANFKGRVISINKYIHGVYDKSGRAQIEKTFIGGLLMQYHKHLPLGLMKRFRMQGMYSEERGAVTKGMYRSLYDFLKIPFKKYQAELELTDDNVNALESIKSIAKNIIDFTLHAKLAYDMLPEYDRANMRRMRTSIYTVLATVFATIAIKAAGDDDDDSLLYNLALYETDRLATEAAQYFPLIAYTEAKKLWQSPIAAGSGVTDAISSLNLLCHMILDGEDFDGEYKSGKFAGESKLKVYIERRIPIWRGIKSSFIDIKENNRYYKIGDNMLNFVDTEEYAEKLKKLF